MPILTGLIVGVLMCIPIGPINIWVMNTRLKRGIGPALAIVLAGSLMDFLYFVTLSSGISLLPINEGTALVLKTVGVLLLLAFGLRELFWSHSPSLAVRETTAAPERQNLWGFFLFGILLYASNPTLVATLTALTAMIRSWQVFTPGILNHVLLGTGAGLGSALWFFILLWLVRRYQHLLQGQALLWATRVCGILVLAVSLWMGVQVVQQIMHMQDRSEERRVGE